MVGSGRGLIERGQSAAPKTGLVRFSSQLPPARLTTGIANGVGERCCCPRRSQTLTVIPIRAISLIDPRVHSHPYHQTTEPGREPDLLAVPSKLRGRPSSSSSSEARAHVAYARAYVDTSVAGAAHAASPSISIRSTSSPTTAATISPRTTMGFVDTLREWQERYVVHSNGASVRRVSTIPT